MTSKFEKIKYLLYNMKWDLLCWGIIMDLKENERIEIELTGNGFLYNMVRIIAGTLIQVGKGKFNPEYVKEMLDAKDRTQAGQTAPPQGLTLMRIEYL